MSRTEGEPHESVDPLPYAPLRGNEGSSHEAGAYVEDGGLAWGDGRYLFVEADEGASIARVAHHAAGDGTAAVADAHGELLLGKEAVGIDGTQLLDEHVAGEQLMGVAEHDGVLGGVELEHIGGLAEGYAEPLALTDGVVGIALMGAEGAPTLIDKPTLPHELVYLGTVLAQEVAIVALDEADLHALALGGLQGETAVGKVLAHGALLHAAEGEEAAREHLLPQAPEEIALVLEDVVARDDVVVAVLMGELHVVARGDVGTAEAVGPLGEEAKLEAGVTHDTGVGGAALHVLVDEVLHDLASELVAHVGHVMLHA